jgi:hypothetical protein
MEFKLLKPYKLFFFDDKLYKLPYKKVVFKFMMILKAINITFSLFKKNNLSISFLFFPKKDFGCTLETPTRTHEIRQKKVVA